MNKMKAIIKQFFLHGVGNRFFCSNIINAILSFFYYLFSIYLIENKKEKMYNPSTIANYFIKKYASKGELTPMKIIKLVYISYAWYLALTEGDKLTKELPQAWNYGPVFPSLYQSFKKYGKTEIKNTIPNTDKWEKINDSEKKFLDKMWDKYGSFGGVYLSAITHTNDSPWDKARKKGFNINIIDEDIIEHYSPRLKPKKIKEEVYKYTESAK